MTTMTETKVTTQVYRVFIKATPEAIWEAITRPEFTARYFHGSLVESTWLHGASYQGYSPDRSQLWVDGVVVEVDPPRKLQHTWRSLYEPESAAEPPSRVTWEIEPQEGGFLTSNGRPRRAGRLAEDGGQRLRGWLDARPQRPQDAGRDRQAARELTRHGGGPAPAGPPPASEGRCRRDDEDEGEGEAEPAGRPLRLSRLGESR